MGGVNYESEGADLKSRKASPRKESTLEFGSVFHGSKDKFVDSTRAYRINYELLELDDREFFNDRAVTQHFLNSLLYYRAGSRMLVRDCRNDAVDGPTVCLVSGKEKTAHKPVFFGVLFCDRCCD